MEPCCRQSGSGESVWVLLEKPGKGLEEETPSPNEMDGKGVLWTLLVTGLRLIKIKQNKNTPEKQKNKDSDKNNQKD